MFFVCPDFQRWFAPIPVFLTSALFSFGQAGGSSDQPVPADKGTLNAAGKFSPKTDNSGIAPDPAGKLKDLGIRFDGDLLRIGAVELDRKSQTITLPAKLQMVDGTIEYFLVHSKGKTHESLFVTDVPPQDIHIACLLAGLSGNTPDKSGKIIVEVTWETNGPPRREPAEKLVAIAKDHPQGEFGGVLSPGPWDYVGSTVDAAGFAATREGSIMSLITDSSALVCNPRPGRVDDTLHVPNTKSLPAPGYPVRIVFRKTPPQTQPKNP